MNDISIFLSFFRFSLLFVSSGFGLASFVAAARVHSAIERSVERLARHSWLDASLGYQIHVLLQPGLSLGWSRFRIGECL